MFLRYLAALLLTLAVTAPGASAAKTIRRAQCTPRAPRPHVQIDDLYSRRALRRARILLQLKLLELRSERLERVRKAIEQSVPIERLLNPM